jgi:hypothetical protein
MLPFIRRTCPLWWMVATGLGLRWHHILVAGSQSDTVDGATYEAEKNVGGFTRKCAGNIQ